LLLRGAESKAFSAGIDLKYADGTGDRASAFAAIDERIERLRCLLAASELPVICMMSGVRYGGGLMLAGFADLRIASSDLRFAMPALDNGLFYPVAGLARLVEIMGLQHVRSLFLRGGPIPVEKLLRGAC
jgi:enoyl-CoA hydratase